MVLEMMVGVGMRRGSPINARGEVRGEEERRKEERGWLLERVREGEKREAWWVDNGTQRRRFAANSYTTKWGHAKYY